MLFLWCLVISLDAKTDVMLEKYEACIIYFQKKNNVFCILIASVSFSFDFCLSVYLYICNYYY